MMVFNGCIENYSPGEDELNIGTMVVTAHLTDKPGIQTVQLSRSVTISNSNFDPLTACYVEIKRADGEYRVFGETDPGYYSQDLDASFLKSGGEYQLIIVNSEEKRLKCWIHRDIPKIYTLDLKNFAGESYRKYPLTFVSGSTWKLHRSYSLLLIQYSLSKNAFWYWSELAKNVQSKGGLFDTQPALTPSNVCNVGDENELVIGYFSISGISEKRIFVGTVQGLEIFMDPNFCRPGVFPMFLHRYPLDKLPLYVARALVMGVNENGKVKDECVDCGLYKNSSFEKPEYWED